MCGGTEDLDFGPDPFDQEILDDDTPVWLCEPCWQDAADEILGNYEI